jgi:hypothetical protein
MAAVYISDNFTIPRLVGSAGEYGYSGDAIKKSNPEFRMPHINRIALGAFLPGIR